MQAELARRFPGVPSWFGEFTGSWWSVVGDRLLEAADPFVLAEMIRTAVAAHRTPRPVPPPRPRPVRRARSAPRALPRARPSGHFFGRLRGRFGPAAVAR
ncbi:hypothetical protein BJF79_21965 [Actinomadura sp. CNU-125]|nr:hypothetical protein BJF79_21965 [Actinomadura sp. CNU-125]